MGVSKEMKIDSEFGRRFYSAWMQSKHKELNQRELGIVFDVSAQSVSSWINSKRYPYIDTGIQISKEFGVNMDWLYVGRLPRFPKDPGRFDKITYRLMDLPKEQLTMIETIIGLFEKGQVSADQVKEWIIAHLKANLQ